MADDDPAIHCTLAEATDLSAGLEAAQIEHLDMDTARIIVIYQSAILIVATTDGDSSLAREFDVELWEPPLRRPDRDAEAVLQDFIAEFTNALPTTLQEN